MKKKDGPQLPPSVYAKGLYYYLKRRDGAKHKWHKLSRVSEGLPSMRLALEALIADAVDDDRMPSLIAKWKKRVMVKHVATTQRDETAYAKVIAERFEEFRCSEVTPSIVADFLEEYMDRPRTYNAYRGMIREFMRFAILLGYRQPGSNPVSEIIKTMRVKARTRYISDSELRRIKVGAMYSQQRSAGQPKPRRNPSGPMLCAIVDMAYLTGQRIGDLLSLEWSDISDKGILFKPAKLEETTQAAVLIQWTPKLKDVVRRLKEMRLKARMKPPQVFCTQTGSSATYNGIHTAWFRAVGRAGVNGVHFHDLRAKAITDKEGREGMQAARTMGAHSTEGQTADYVRNRSARTTKATR